MAQRKRQVPRHPADKPPLPKALNGGNLIQGRLGLTQRQKPRVKWPTGSQASNKRRSSVRQLTEALKSGRAEAKPGAKVDLSGVPIGEAGRAGAAFEQSLQRSAPRRAAAKAKGRAYKARTAKRSGGR